MIDRFVFSEYLDILKTTLNDLDFSDKPELIWNLDETSLLHDPSKTKIVGAKGKPSSCTTSSSGIENTTVLSTVLASGGEATPLIVFKGRNIWDSCAPSNDDLICIDSDEDFNVEMYEEDFENQQQEVASSK
ncbi:hypothetical protein ILUMI_13905 [Ignelater luminosus]|uniref:DDE-1 domain-containing protein n=1 Tax=Ignelater luminosus TaxID=2038154 RepID=A0A8K0CTI3_IGNLU|nr:hypothetical protein ILUMI_13905 [Ignelater luminosus]